MLGRCIGRYDNLGDLGNLGFHQQITNEDLLELLKSHYALEESVVTAEKEMDDPQFPGSYTIALR